MTTPSIVQTILLVDDRPENLMALEAILEGPDRRLLKASNGNDALTQALKQDISLILLDVQMPDMDGFEVAELLRRNTKTRHIPVIFCTAISKEKKYLARGFDVGAVDYLFKPIDPDLLTAKVRVFLELDMQKRKLQQTVLQLHRVQKENERLLRAMGEGVIGLDKGGLVTFANPAAASLLGRDTQQLIAQPVESLIFLDAGGKPQWLWPDSPAFKAIMRGEPFQSADLFCMQAGRPKGIEMTITPIHDRNSVLTGAVAVLRDGGTREKVQATFQERRKHVRKRLSADLTLFDRATGTNVGRLLNLSEGGMRVVTRKGFTDGQRSVFSMILPRMINGSTTVSVDAICVWSQQAGYGGDTLVGFRFAEMKAESVEVIRYLLEKY
jgi:CheY-like chemotaxis protein